MRRALLKLIVVSVGMLLTMDDVACAARFAALIVNCPSLDVTSLTCPMMASNSSSCRGAPPPPDPNPTYFPP